MKYLCLLLFLSLVAPAWAQTESPAPATIEPPGAPLTAVEAELLREENARLRVEIDRLRHDAVNAPVIDRENQKLREQIITLESQQGRLAHENQTLGSWRDGLKTGAGIFAVGLVIGLLLGRARRRSGWSEV